jgi:hypothetical protein
MTNSAHSTSLQAQWCLYGGVVPKMKSMNGLRPFITALDIQNVPSAGYGLSLTKIVYQLVSQKLLLSGI